MKDPSQRLKPWSPQADCRVESFVHVVAMRSGILHAVAVLLITFTISCRNVSDHTYVPGPGFTQTLTVSAAIAANGSLKVCEWLELKATRRTGPWVKGEKPKGSRPGCRWRRPPAAVEEDVQSNVTWHVEPTGSAEFNIPGPLNIRQRLVRFTQPGQYKLWATSSGCGSPFGSNVIELTVVRAERDGACAERP